MCCDAPSLPETLLLPAKVHTPVLVSNCFNPFFCFVPQVVEVLSDALSLPETPVPVKVARLLLVSDVLHNSTAPVRNASRYRSLLEAALPDIFESLQVSRLPARLPHRILQNPTKRKEA